MLAGMCTQCTHLVHVVKSGMYETRPRINREYVRHQLCVSGVDLATRVAVLQVRACTTHHSAECGVDVAYDSHVIITFVDRNECEAS
jgi:hypothetical protein